ncbi:hypothetical protein EMA8858_00405 [Emticicia aquatica]|uniref:Thioredoxin domain-containing protein n=1 Tax=Emticicia aquatica TaxID=1681835 RepID=A0ABM9AKL3_9BACT|nr:redoxin domain-containing protein [Emticicia aquatica]CAH0994296.1 hypothetical protein EMA8858_00405 [Emticicia aquatica]
MILKHLSHLSISSKRNISSDHLGEVFFYFIIFFILCFCPAIAQKLQTDSQQIFNFKELKSNQASIVVFFDPECPICQKYTKNLTELDKRYSIEGIKVYVVYPFKVLEKASLAEFREEYKFDLPIIYDSKRKLLKKLKGNYSPEVFLLNARRQILYHGAIDNWFYGLGRNRATPTAFYLLDAITSFQKGEAVKIKYVEPVGCEL